MDKKSPKVDPREQPIPTDLLVRIAEWPTGGSGEGSYVSGRIQSMARELLKYRNAEEKK